MLRFKKCVFVVAVAGALSACGSVESKPPSSNNDANNGTANNGANNGTANNGANNGSSNNGSSNNGTPVNNTLPANNVEPSNNGTPTGDRLFVTNGDGVLSADEISAGCRAAEACNIEQFNEQFATVEECISATQGQIEEAVSVFGPDCEAETNAFLECTLGTSICADGQLSMDDPAADACAATFEDTGCSTVD